MRKYFFAVLFLAISLVSGNANAQKQGETDGVLPRMASVRSNNINARSGPGARYPIDWVYSQKGAPVEIIAEFELWRKIKDWENSVSWVHRAMLSSKRTVKVITPGENNIYSKADYDSKVIAKVEDQAVGDVKRCASTSKFCLIKFGNVEGWVAKSNLFGVYNNEDID